MKRIDWACIEPRKRHQEPSIVSHTAPDGSTVATVEVAPGNVVRICGTPQTEAFEIKDYAEVIYEWVKGGRKHVN